MTIAELGSLGEFIASIAVLATLVILVGQVRQTRKLMQNDALVTLEQSGFTAFDPVYEGRNAEILRCGLQDPESLGEQDRFMFDMLMSRVLTSLESLIRRQTEGDLPEDALTRAQANFRFMFTQSPGGKAFILSRRRYLSAGLITLLGHWGLSIETESV